MPESVFKSADLSGFPESRGLTARRAWRGPPVKVCADSCSAAGAAAILQADNDSQRYRFRSASMLRTFERNGQAPIPSTAWWQMLPAGLPRINALWMLALWQVGGGGRGYFSFGRKSPAWSRRTRGGAACAGNGPQWLPWIPQRRSGR